jgi:hypothetical protein
MDAVDRDVEWDVLHSLIIPACDVLAWHAALFIYTYI